MGLLDSVLGSVLAGQNNAQGGGLGGLGNVLGSVLGGGQQQQPGQSGGINMGLVAALAPVLMGMLANNSQHGGLGGLLDKFTQAGAGDAADDGRGGQRRPGARARGGRDGREGPALDRARVASGAGRGRVHG